MEEKKLIFDEEFLRSGEGGYVFLSHSHKDIEDVRTIRNVFEQKGFEPLCFFLKCLSDDDEVEDLIKREIDARDFFVYVDSENAQNSRWVRTEREYVKKSGKNQNSIFRIKLEEFQNNQQSKVYLESEIEKIASSKRVFLSYAVADEDVADKVRIALMNRDFKVWMDRYDIMVGENWAEQIEKAMSEAAKYGCVIPIITENSMKSKLVEREITLAIKYKTQMMPVFVGDLFKLNDVFAFFFADIHIYHIDNATPENIERFIDKVADFMSKH